MKIIVATIGSRGDVQPYINLCQGLVAAGHEVTLATNPTLCTLVETHGVRSVPVGPPVDMAEAGARLMEQSFNNMWIGLIRVMQLGARLVQEAYPDVLAVCRGADLVVTSDTGSGIAEAEKLGLPWISITLQPGRIASARPDPSLVDRWIWPVLGRIFIAPTNRFRRRVGAPPAKDITDLMSKRMILLPVSQHVEPRNPNWPAVVHQTGYWYARPQSGWSPPEDLVRFLDAGDPPVAVSLGVMSLSGKKSRDGARAILQALRDAKVRAVIQGWEADLQDLDRPETVFYTGSLPHDWLFGQVRAVIHHGGFGTTAAVLRSGVPGIVIPHIIDQFAWAQKVFDLGVSPRFITRGQLTAPKLCDAIVKAVGDTEMRQRAQILGNKISAEPDGVTAAVRCIERAL